MCRSYLLALLVLGTILAPLTGQGQPPQPATPAKKVKTGKNPLSRHLTVVDRFVAPSQLSTELAPPWECDSDGNVHLHAEPYGVAGISKLSPKAKLLASFQPSSADIKVDLITSFSIAQDGDVYALAYPHEYKRYVFVYQSDGTYKSKVQLQTGFAWVVNAVAAFQSGNILVAGQRHDSDKNAPLLPFTGLFASDGALLKEVVLTGDVAIHKLNVAHDPTATETRTSSSIPLSNTQMEAGPDGNVYVMRWLTPAIFYVISPAGEVVRTFTVEPGEENYKPMAFHLSQGRLAVSFSDLKAAGLIVRVTDLEGKVLETYVETNAQGKKGMDELGDVFACYRAYPESFVFLSLQDDSTVQFTIAEPR